MLLFLSLAASAQAEEISFAPQYPFTSVTMPNEKAIAADQPVQLQADQIDYLQNENQVMASGQVEVVQGNTLLICDKLIYDRTKEIVTAVGHVSVVDETGNVLFADEVELRDQLSRGVIVQLKLRMNDESLFAAARARRVNEDVLLLDHALYSPCKVKCAEDLEAGESPKAPLWQMRGEHVTIDNVKQTIVYRDAWMEVFGIPVFYTPYLSTATPNADAKSGFLVPEFERSDILGNVYRLPFYYAIAPDRAMTITPVQSSKEGLLLRADYRQKYDQGEWKFDSSITHPRDRDPLGNLTHGRQVRGHFFTEGNFTVNPDRQWGFDIKRTTDDTYMRKYQIDDSILLQSRVYGSAYGVINEAERSSAQVEAVAFQGLAVTDNSKEIPLVLPLVNVAYETDPMAYGGRYFANSNAMILSRDVGAKTRRLANQVGWRLPYISDDGQVLEFKSSLRADIYDVEDVALTNGTQFSGVTGRMTPEGAVSWRYPFIRHGERSDLVLEPVAQMAISPGGGNSEKIPNEDSARPELSDGNLFSNNHFAGYDRVEHGLRASYGLRGGWNYNRAYLDGLFGQYYREQEDPYVSIATDPSDRWSDYVSKIGLQYQPLYLAYRFRLDRDTLDPKRKELELQYNGQRFRLSTSYLSLQNDPLFAPREEIAMLGSLEFNKNWVISGAVRRDLQLDMLTNAGAELLFKNECVNVSAVVNRVYTRDRELKPDTKYLLRLSLKNLN